MYVRNDPLARYIFYTHTLSQSQLKLFVWVLLRLLYLPYKYDWRPHGQYLKVLE